EGCTAPEAQDLITDMLTLGPAIRVGLFLAVGRREHPIPLHYVVDRWELEHRGVALTQCLGQCIKSTLAPPLPSGILQGSDNMSSLECAPTFSIALEVSRCWERCPDGLAQHRRPVNRVILLHPTLLQLLHKLLIDPGRFTAYQCMSLIAL